jgi:hypothetical protein
MDINTLTPALRDALMAEIAKELPRLLKQAEKNAKPRETPTRRKRIPRGLARHAIHQVIWDRGHDGASKDQILRLAPKYLEDHALNENTLKSWLVVLRREGKIEKRDDSWVAVSAPKLGVLRMGRRGLTDRYAYSNGNGGQHG